VQVRHDEIADDSQRENEPSDSEESHVSIFARQEQNRHMSDAPIAVYRPLTEMQLEITRMAPCHETQIVPRRLHAEIRHAMLPTYFSMGKPLVAQSIIPPSRL
jgi:hypothetical protein